MNTRKKERIIKNGTKPVVYVERKEKKNFFCCVLA